MIKKLLVLISFLFAGRYAQNLLKFIIKGCQYLMGIGSGGDIKNSGERVLFNLLDSAHEGPHVIFDVGANTGDFVEIAKQYIPENKYVIFCFEPARKSFIFLSQKFDDSNIHLNNLALSNFEGQSKLFYDTEGSKMASLTKRNMEHFSINFSENENVIVSSVDKYCFENNIKNISLMKIDVEGHELDVLKGAINLLRTGSIRIISFEFGGTNIDTRVFFQDFWYFFKDLNYCLYRISPSNYLYKLKSYSEFDEQFVATNFVAILSENKFS